MLHRLCSIHLLFLLLELETLIEGTDAGDDDVDANVLLQHPIQVGQVKAESLNSLGAKQFCGESTYAAIIGSGIAGVGAGVALSEQGKPFVILEAEQIPGGHEATWREVSEVDQEVTCHLDVGFMFAHRHAYPGLVSVIERANLTMTPEFINFTTPRFSNRKVTTFQHEVKRFEELAKEGAHLQNITFVDWLHANDFSEEFMTHVILPAVSISFVEGKDSAYFKSAAEMTGMLARKHWLGLTESMRPELFRVSGGNDQIIKSLLSEHAMDLRTDAKVVSVRVISDKEVQIQFSSKLTGAPKGCITAEMVIWSVSPKIVLETYQNPTLEQLTLLHKYEMRASFGILHSCPDLVFASMFDQSAQHAVAMSNDSLIISGRLGYENSTACPQVLSISENRFALERHLQTCERVLRQYSWEHPLQSMTVLHQLRQETFSFGNVRFVGSWAAELSHENAFQSGRGLGEWHDFH